MQLRELLLVVSSAKFDNVNYFGLIYLIPEYCQNIFLALKQMAEVLPPQINAGLPGGAPQMQYQQVSN